MKILVDGSICKCNKGNAPSIIISKENSKVKISKMKVIVKTDVTIMPPYFGICFELTQKFGGTSPIPCIPIVTNWQTQINNKKILGKELVTDKDKLPCSNGGQITVLNNLNNKINSNK
ncbi:PAAR-like protein [Cetobacterium somerae]